MIKRQWRQLPCGLLLLTRGAISAQANTTCDPQQTQLWGLGRVIGAEQPQLRVRLLDLSADQLNEQAVEMVAELAVSETEDNQYALRDGQLLVPRMQQTRLPKTATFEANENGCYLDHGWTWETWSSSSQVARDAWSPASRVGFSSPARRRSFRIYSNHRRHRLRSHRPRGGHE